MNLLRIYSEILLNNLFTCRSMQCIIACIFWDETGLVFE